MKMVRAFQLYIGGIVHDDGQTGRKHRVPADLSDEEWLKKLGILNLLKRRGLNGK